MRPPPQRSAAALAKRAEKRGRTPEEQKALDRQLLELHAKERQVKADKAIVGRPPVGSKPADKVPQPADGEPSLEKFLVDEGRGLVGHRLSCAGSGVAKVVSARPNTEGDGIHVKLRFDSPVAMVANEAPKRAAQVLICRADVVAGRFTLVQGSSADWSCSACSFRNFASRQVCNQCHKTRHAASKDATPAVKLPTRLPAAKKTNVDPKRAWEGSVVAPEKIASNKRLREQYSADPAKLSAGERERAKLLMARDERKGSKKAARLARHTAIATGVGAPGWRARNPKS